MNAPPLDQFQKAAVCDSRRQLFVSAPAGSGKTRVLVERVGWLVHSGVPAPRILVLTFAKRAARELRERLQQRGLGEVLALTFHAWALRCAGKVHTNSFELVTEERRAHLLRLIFIKFLQTRYGPVIRLQAKNLNWSLPFFVREVLVSIERLQQFGVTPQVLESWQKNLGQSWPTEIVIKVWQQYCLLLQRRGACDFTQLIQQTTYRLKNNVIGAPHYQHVLVDEVQDANRDEMELLQALLGAHTPVTWVGDRRQAIYAWRGAVPFTVNAPSCELKFNYRSDASIVRLVNATCRSQQQQSMRATRPRRFHPTLVAHGRYQESAALAAVLRELQLHDLAMHDCLVLVRTNTMLERIQTGLREFYKIRAMTVHAAKGLEARAVVVVGCSHDRHGFPLPEHQNHHPLDAYIHHEQQAEEARLWYVALTRARDHLILLGTGKQLSPFVKCLPRSVMRRVTMPQLSN